MSIQTKVVGEGDGLLNEIEKKENTKKRKKRKSQGTKEQMDFTNKTKIATEKGKTVCT